MSEPGFVIGGMLCLIIGFFLLRKFFVSVNGEDPKMNIDEINVVFGVLTCAGIVAVALALIANMP